MGEEMVTQRGKMPGGREGERRGVGVGGGRKNVRGEGS